MTTSLSVIKLSIFPIGVHSVKMKKINNKFKKKNRKNTKMDAKNIDFQKVNKMKFKLITKPV